jgi:hypothetical protein
MGEALRITVIATGFERMAPPRRAVVPQQYSRPAARRAPAPRPTAPQPAPVPQDEEPSSKAESNDRTSLTSGGLDIPAFLRRR